jgi:phage terminase large subunit
MQGTKRFLCGREYQSTIADSVHRILSDIISEDKMLASWYEVTRSEIRGKNGTLFIFRGLKFDPQGIKSLEGIDIAWLEEAEKISNESLDMLIPTIRKPESQIWFTFNPYHETDPVYERFIKHNADNALVVKVGWADNPWFPDVLREEMEWDKKTNPDKYEWIWLGKPVGISNAQIFRNKYEVTDFESGSQDQIYIGVDWGFSQDPNVMVGCFIRERCLYVEHEAYGVGVELDEIAKLFASVPYGQNWTAYADSARPETISYLQRNGYANMQSVDKWKGSVEDGIEYIKSFERVFIHPRCKHTLQEFELYQYKVDRLTGDVLPIIVDKENHVIDSLRYALSDVIKMGGHMSSYEFDAAGVLGL